jgi:hypothetical protein
MTTQDGIGNVDLIINRFGGLRPMARKMNVHASTIQGWKKRGMIPAERMNEFLKAAKDNNISLDGINIPVKIEEERSREAEIPSQPYESPLKPKMPETNAKPHKKRKVETRFDKKQHPTLVSGGQIKRQIVKQSLITTFSVFIILFIIGYILFGEEAKELNNLATNQQETETQIQALRTGYEDFKQQATQNLADVSGKIGTVTSAIGLQKDEAGNIVIDTQTPLMARVQRLEDNLNIGDENFDLGALIRYFDGFDQTILGEDGTQAFTNFKGMIANMQGQMGALNNQVEQTKQGAAELSQSVQTMSARDLGAAAMLLALTQMRDSLNRSEPFEQDLAMLQNLVGDNNPELNQAINRLAPYAASGVLSPEGLSNELKNLSSEIVTAAMNGEDVSIQDRVKARLGEVLSIEKDGKPLMVIEEEAIIAEAKAALDKGNVAEAVQILNRLDGEAATAASPFMTQALGAIQAQETLDMLMNKATQVMQNPQSLQGMIKSAPAEIKKQMQGTISGSQDSGLIILQ